MTKVLIEMICDEGYCVSISSGDDRRAIVHVFHDDTGEAFVIRDAAANEAACELAQQI